VNAAAHITAPTGFSCRHWWPRSHRSAQSW
jgi:hypothetical protein